MGRNLMDLTGLVFGSWTVLRFGSVDGRRTTWLARCGCGVERLIRADALRGGLSRKCTDCQAAVASAANRTHGQTKTPTWYSWRAMRTRCNIPTSSDYARYGGRGITYCAKWDTFEGFLEDMGVRPAGMTLDRIDTDGGYTKDNCRWATNKRQSRNKRKTVFLTAQGVRKSLSDWADDLGLRHITLYKRYAAGWSDEEIVGTPKLPPASPKQRGRRTRRLNKSTGAVLSS